MYRKLLLILLVVGITTATSCRRYGCPSNPQQVDLASKKAAKAKPGKSTLFPKDMEKKKGIRSR